MIYEICTVITHKVEDTSVAIGFIIGFGVAAVCLLLLVTLVSKGPDQNEL